MYMPVFALLVSEKKDMLDSSIHISWENTCRCSYDSKSNNKWEEGKSLKPHCGRFKDVTTVVNMTMKIQM